MGGSAHHPGVLEGDAAPTQSPYQRLSQRMQDISGDGGVLKDVLREGTGDFVTPDASVIVNYSGYLEHMDKPFDSNCLRKTPRLMKLGEDITLLGMELGLLSMRTGELARFLFKPRYAYGTLGCPPMIPPNTTVLFEIELVDFLDSAESDKFCALTAEQQDQFPLETVLKVAATEREFGNYLFRQNRFYDAKRRYKRALLLLHRRRAAPLEEQHLVKAAKLLVLLNLSLTYLKLERPMSALSYGEKALVIDQKNAKALFRCGQACLLMTEYLKARDFLVRAQKEQPFNHDINNELKKLASTYQDYVDREKEMCHRMFASGDSGSTGGENARRTAASCTDVRPPPVQTYGRLLYRHDRCTAFSYTDVPPPVQTYRLLLYRRTSSCTDVRPPPVQTYSLLLYRHVRPPPVQTYRLLLYRRTASSCIDVRPPPVQTYRLLLYRRRAPGAAANTNAGGTEPGEPPAALPGRALGAGAARLSALPTRPGRAGAPAGSPTRPPRESSPNTQCRVQTPHTGGGQPVCGKGVPLPVTVGKWTILPETTRLGDAGKEGPLRKRARAAALSLEDTPSRQGGLLTSSPVLPSAG
ncbi:inactive peptidyl-prolyl cis-trans isomerase FKBP6 [Rhynchocyon petersi]